MSNAYATVLRVPGAARFCLGGFLGRMPMSMLSIIVLLLVLDRTGSYALAGTASAVASLTQAGVAPLVGRLVDRRGQSAVVPALLLLLFGGLATLVVAAVTDGPAWVMFVGAVLAGAGLLPYGALSRSRWAHLLRDDDQGMSTALALESIVDEGVFVIGPVVVTALALTDPTLGAAAAAGFAATGTLLFLASGATEPPQQRPRAGERTVRRPPGLWVVVVTSGLLGVVFGSVEVSTVAFARLEGRPQFAGVLLGLIALGSCAAGLWYGTRSWRRDLPARYRASLLTLAVGALPLLVVPSVPWMAAACLVVGLSIAPTLIAGSGLIAGLMPVSLRTEGFSWQSSSINVGVAGGAALAGSLIDTVGVRAGFGVLPLAALAAVAATTAGAGLLRVRHPDGQPFDAATVTP